MYVVVSQRPIHLLRKSVSYDVPWTRSNLPAVDCQYLARDIRARLACEEDNWAFEVVWMAPSASRYPIKNASSTRFIIDQGVVHVCVDVSRRNLSTVCQRLTLY